jgi:hypothetical protein
MPVSSELLLSARLSQARIVNMRLAPLLVLLLTLLTLPAYGLSSVTQ